MKPETRERLIGIMMCVILVPPMFIGALVILGMMMDGIADSRTEHDRCLKHATNGYEIQKCR